MPDAIQYLGIYIHTQLLLNRPADKAPNRMGLPAREFHDLVDIGAGLAAEQGKDLLGLAGLRARRRCGYFADDCGGFGFGFGGAWFHGVLLVNHPGMGCGTSNALLPRCIKSYWAISQDIGRTKGIGHPVAIPGALN